jgi:hypothetical protein
MCRTGIPPNGRRQKRCHDAKVLDKHAAGKKVDISEFFDKIHLSAPDG